MLPRLEPKKTRYIAMVVALFMVVCLLLSFNAGPGNRPGDYWLSRGVTYAAAPFTLFPCATDEEAARMQKAMLPADSTAKCDEVGVCTCPTGDYFDGFRCKKIAGSIWEDQFSTLKKKWKEVPAAKEVYAGDKIKSEGTKIRMHTDVAEDGEDTPDPGRAFSGALLHRTDSQLEEYWDSLKADDTFTMFHASIFNGKRVLDIGSGLGRQTLQFAIHGAHVTFADVAPTNLEVIKRVAHSKGISDRTSFIVVTSIEDLGKELDKLPPFDVVTSFGSMHHAPREINQPEYHVLAKHLKKGGKWLQLAYPLGRWKNAQTHRHCPTPDSTAYKTSFADGWWGGDGCRTPWAEWYEPGKWLKTLQPYEFSMNWCGIINNKPPEFIWFDMVKLN